MDRIAISILRVSVLTRDKNRLTFVGDPVPDTDSGSLFHFPHHCGIGNFRSFISISHTITSRFSQHKMTDADKVVYPQQFGCDPADLNPD